MYEEAPCGYLSVHPDGHILKANRTFLEWTGYELEELTKLTFVDLLVPGARIFHETHYLPLLHLHGHVEELTLDMFRADGSRLPALVNSVLDRDRAGDPLIVRIAVFDATERRRYERELLASRRRAEMSEAYATNLARTLQQTLMPPRSPRIPGLEVATLYRPAGKGAEIGGDFYDFFELADHDWVVAIGDVAGKGVDAAVVASLARHTIRALCVSEPSPARVLHGLNQVIHHDPSARFCTVALLRLRLEENRWEVTMSVGGHPSPILLDAGAEPRELAAPSYLVGAFDFAAFEDSRYVVAPGTTILLHTDGVTEARREGDLYGEARFAEFLATSTHEPEPLVRDLLEDVLAFQPGDPSDDIALVALQVPPAEDR